MTVLFRGMNFAEHVIEKSKERMSMRKFIQNESGATAIEYGLIAALIALGIMTAATGLASNTSDTFDRIGTAVAGASDNGDGN